MFPTWVTAVACVQGRNAAQLPQKTCTWFTTTHIALIALLGHPSAVFEADATYVGNRPLIRSYHLTQLRALQEWKFDPEVLCESARVHGRMQKQGSSADMPWRLWNMAHDRTLDPQIPIYAGAAIYISRKYRVLYIRQQKSSSSSIIQALEQLFCRDPTACKEDEFTHSTSPVSKRVWHEYLVLTWVRNPWMRMLSTYSMICGGVRDDVLLRRRKPGGAPGERCYVPFSDFSRDPYTMVQACPEQGCCLWHKGHWEPEFIPGHLNDQSHTIYSQTGNWMVDFIGRTEYIDADWADFLTLLNEHAGTSFRTSGVPMENPSPPSSQPEGVYVSCLNQRIPLFNETTMRNIAAQFARDLYVLGYDERLTHGGRGQVT